MTKKYIGLVLGPLSFMLLMLIQFEGLPQSGQAILASTAWVAIWWIFESIPIAATSLLPVILFPLTGGLDIKTTTTTYYSPMIMLFLGGFIIALAIEKWNLHQRIALYIIKGIGTDSSKIILGFMVATAFLSMWISNTATALMMLPIGMAIARKITDLSKGNHAEVDSLSTENLTTTADQFDKSLMLSIAYAASIGGMATLIGTPTNAIFSAISLELYHREITFAEWLSFGLPITILLLLVGWLYLTKVIFNSSISGIGDARAEIDRQVIDLGKMTHEEKLILIVFSATAIAWMLRSFVLNQLLPGINDTIIAMMGAMALFLIPSAQKGVKLIDWETASKLPWGILLLFGGGLTIAAGFKSSGLANWLGGQLSGMDQLVFGVILLMVIVMVNFFTEITSNVATASVLLPILASLSQSIGVHPFGLMVGACVAASCAFMLPVATPANAISYSSGYLSMNDMIRTGFWMNLVSSLLLFLCIYFLMPLIWGIDLNAFPIDF